MDRQTISNLDERDFVTSLIMSDKCCQILIPFISLNYFDCDYARIVVQWVMDFYRKFKRAPKGDIVSYYRVHCDELQDESLKELISAYITKLSESDTINNEDYLLDRSRDFLDQKALNNYVNDLNACLQTRSIDKARKVQSQYKKITVTETNEVDLLSKSSMDVIKNALNTVDEELFTLPECLSEVVGKIHRNDFIAILAGMKKGKSWCLQYLALEAMKQKLNVVYVSMEMTREEVVQRMWKTLFASKSGLIPEGTYEASRFVEDTSEEGRYNMELIDINVKDCERPSPEELQQQLRAMNNYSGNLKVIAYPAFGASVADITDRIEELAKDGFIADVVVIDYSDITKPIGGGSELRNQLDMIWKHLRGFAMKFHCCMITASQTNRAGLSSSIVGAETVAEDIRKLAHVTSMISLEQTPAMRQNHLMRIRNIAMRNGYSGDPCVFCQALSLGQFVFGPIIHCDDFNFDFSDD